MRRRTGLALAAIAAMAAAPAASASTLTRDSGGTLILTATAGEQNDVNLDITENFGEPDRFTVTDYAGITSVPTGCTEQFEDTNTSFFCPVPAGFRAVLDDGNDEFFEFDAFTFPIDVAGGVGNDKLVGYRSASSSPEPQGTSTLRGGLDHDEIEGAGGNDVVLGEDGNDTVSGDKYEPQGTDVIDGGGGYDKLDQDWSSLGAVTGAPVQVSLDGAANDGRSGEGDNVVAVEDITNNSPGSYAGSDAPERFSVGADGNTSLSGGGGSDSLRTVTGSDTIDAGSGDDEVEAGYGDDTITGGPGRDTIVAEAKYSSNAQFGNDTVLVRDGEVDSVTCGVGADRVVADGDDVVAPDCETVERPANTGGGGGGTGGGGGDTGGGGPGPGTVTQCRVPKLKGKRLPAARRALKARNCRLGKVKKVRSRKKVGTIIKQSPAAGKVLPAGTKVRVTVAKRR